MELEAAAEQKKAKRAATVGLLAGILFICISAVAMAVAWREVESFTFLCGMLLLLVSSIMSKLSKVYAEIHDLKKQLVEMELAIASRSSET
jgi:hypothetical protein